MRWLGPGEVEAAAAAGTGAVGGVAPMGGTAIDCRLLYVPKPSAAAAVADVVMTGGATGVDAVTLPADLRRLSMDVMPNPTLLLVVVGVVSTEPVPGLLLAGFGDGGCGSGGSGDGEISLG